MHWVTHGAHCLAPEASVSSSFRPLPLLNHSDHFATRSTPQSATTALPSCRQSHGFLSHKKEKKTVTRMSASVKGSFETSRCLDLSHSRSQCHFCSLQFSSRWYVYALGKAHKLYAPPRLSENFPNVAFETVPMLSVLLRFVSAMVCYVIPSPGVTAFRQCNGFLRHNQSSSGVTAFRHCHTQSWLQRSQTQLPFII